MKNAEVGVRYCEGRGNTVYSNDMLAPGCMTVNRSRYKSNEINRRRKQLFHKIGQRRRNSI